MNTAEIEVFAARLALFTENGASIWDAERLADGLVKRDRQRDGRRLCLECTRLQGYGSWRCGDWKRSGMGRQGLAMDLAYQLQHCPAFTPARLPLGVELVDIPPAPPVPATPKPEPGGADTGEEAHGAYMAHHLHCPQCQAAGRGIEYGGRCAVGRALWKGYAGTCNLQTKGA